ncbi:hypothetical protein ACJJTC_016278 [Scirpophaga incertulas]
MAAKKGEYFAFCTFCKTDLSIGSGEKNDLFKHTKSSVSQKLITNLFSNVEPVKRGEIFLAAFITEHNIPINVMEHMPQLLKSICPDSQIAKSINCDRTKTTAIMKVQIGDVCVSFMPLEEATSEKLYEHVKKDFSDNNIPMDNMIGFASDGANAMMGQHNSLSSRLVAANPNLFILNCVCHSFHLCASYSCLKLSREPETLIRDIYNCFSNSRKRTGILKEFLQYGI